MNAVSTPAERLHARARLVKLRCLPRPTEALAGVTIGRPAVPGGSPTVSGDGPIADEVLAWAFRTSTARQLRRLAATTGLDSDALRQIVHQLAAAAADVEVPAPPRRPPIDSDPERLVRVLVAAPAGPPRPQGAPATAW